MTRRITRTAEFDLTLQIKRDDFIRPPRPAQRSWLLNKAIGELVSELRALDESARHFVPGADSGPLEVDRAKDALSDQQIMEDWQIPLMAAMARFVTERRGDVLEIGFGRGISADLIQAGGVESHTIVECNPTIVERFEIWRSGYPERDIRLVEGMWQDCTSRFGLYDGIFFHAYPLTEREYLEEAVKGVTFAAHFFGTASEHLKSGGVFTYLTHEIDCLSRQQQRLLLRYFSELSTRKVSLSVPQDTGDAWWADSMIVVKATK